MKSMKLINLVITVTTLLLMLGACETELPETCPDLKFTIDIDKDSSEYTIVADFDGIEEIVYGWYVNDKLVDTENLDSARDNTFDFKLAPGAYKICIRAESIECADSVMFCQEFTVRNDDEKDECPELEFDKEEIHDGKYLFEADFDGRDSIFYVWYVNGDSIESEALGKDRFHKFDYEFEDGKHIVCIKAVTDRCGVLEFCKEIDVERDEHECAEVFFEAEKEGENAYYFFADFDGMEHTSYKWYVNGEYVDKENFEGHDTDHKLYWQFESGEHSVCIESVGTDSCEATDFCKEIFIEGEPEGCPDLSFEYDHLGNNEYKFIANFEGKDHLNWYGWYIDGDLVENEGTDHDGDHYLYRTFEPGTYEVCLMTETPDCPEGVEYCKEIVIETQECVDLSYTAEEVEGGYKFTADFEERDNVTYIWKVFINDDFQGDEVRHAGSEDDHEFFWEFQPGVEYEVCLKQDGCSETIKCQVFSVD